jgi:hypothetical protein
MTVKDKTENKVTLQVEKASESHLCLGRDFSGIRVGNYKFFKRM